MQKINVCIFFVLSAVFAGRSVPAQNMTAFADSVSREFADPQSWVAQGGCWTFTDSGIVAQAGKIGWHNLYYNLKRYADFEISARLSKIVEGGTFGILLRYEEQQALGYAFMLFPNGQYRFSTLNKQTDSSLFQAPVNIMQHDPSAWNAGKITCNGSQFSFYMNGQLLASLADTTFARGKIGFFIGGDPRQKAIFRIMSLKEINE